MVKQNKLENQCHVGKTMNLKRHSKIILLVLVSAVLGSAGSFLVLSLVLSQPTGEPDPYVSSFQWQNYEFSREYNSSYVLVKGILVNPRITEVRSVTLTFDIYVQYIHHQVHEIKRVTLLKREMKNFGNLAEETTKFFSFEILYYDRETASFRFSHVSFELSWT